MQSSGFFSAIVLSHYLHVYFFRSLPLIASSEIYQPLKASQKSSPQITISWWRRRKKKVWRLSTRTSSLAFNKKKIVDKGNFTGAGQDVCVLILLPDKTASFGWFSLICPISPKTRVRKGRQAASYSRERIEHEAQALGPPFRWWALDWCRAGGALSC